MSQNICKRKLDTDYSITIEETSWGSKNIELVTKSAKLSDKNKTKIEELVNVEDETDNSLGRPKIEVETDHNSTTTLQKFLSSTTEFYHHHQESLSIVSRTLNYEMNPKHNQGVKKTFNPNFENVISEL